jgi:hypothetical protein
MRDVGTDEMQSLKGKKLLVYCRSGTATPQRSHPRHTMTHSQPAV